MNMLSTFFPRRQRLRTVVHAGALALRPDDGLEALQRFLARPRPREIFLVHHGEPSFRDVAESAGVADIQVAASPHGQANAATEMALALGAGRLDFTIDAPGVRDHEGHVLHEIGLQEAERLSRDPGVRPRIRAKLRAGCAALRKGMSRVRIGDPDALERERATMLVHDPAPTRLAAAARRGPLDGAAPARAVAAPARAATSGADAVAAVGPVRAGVTRRPRPPRPRDPSRRRRGPTAPRLDAAARDVAVAGDDHRAVRVPAEEPIDSLHDPWWRLRGRAGGRHTRVAAPG